MKHHGIGIGYRYPHDFDGADVDQRYLPDDLEAAQYYIPSDQGYEATIGERMARRAAARETARATGKTPRSRTPGPEIKPRAGDGLMKTREENRRRLADTEKRDANE